jgi:hypothetical protein
LRSVRRADSVVEGADPLGAINRTRSLGPCAARDGERG